MKEKSKNKICFIMPVYPPHFNYAREFISSYFKYEFDKEADLIFIFTNENEAKEFTQVNFTRYYKSLILPKILRKIDGIVNIKKFFALMQIQKDYEYSIVLDSESELVKNIDLKALCEEFYKQKILYGNATTCNALGIKENSRQFFKETKDTKIANDELYLWFNQPCIYKNAFLQDFFAKAEFFKEEDLLRLNGASFDYYVYMYYLLFYKNFQIVNLKLTSSWGFLEHPYFDTLNKEILNYEFYCAHPKLYTRLNQNKLFLLINIDRNKEIQKSFTEKECFNLAKNLENQAVLQIKNHLSYKLGATLIKRNIESKNNIFKFALTGGGAFDFFIQRSA